jgi:hypothetical protein
MGARELANLPKLLATTKATPFQPGGPVGKLPPGATVNTSGSGGGGVVTGGGPGSSG